ncbi:MAG: VCBS repeat-containing protein [Thermoplasmata archaeon]
MRASIISVVGVMCMVLCAIAVTAVKPAQTTGFVGNVEGLWYYENTSFHIQAGFVINDANNDGKAEAVIALMDRANNTLYVGALSGSGKIAFNNSTQIWGWVPVKNFTEGRDQIALIDDVNGDGVKDIAVTNDTVNTTHVRVNIISGKTGSVLRTNVFAARDVNFYYYIQKTIDIKTPQDGIGELLLVMNHSVAKPFFGSYYYYENYLRVYAIDPTTGNSIWANPIDKGPVNFLMAPTNPYLVAVSEDVSGNNKPDIFIVSSGLNLSIGITFNNSEISVIDCQTQSTVWERKDLTSGFVLDFRLYDFTGDGKNDVAMSKVSIGVVLFPSFGISIAGNTTEILYGNNGVIASKRSHDVGILFSGMPVNSIMSMMSFGFYSEVFSIQNFADFSGDNVPDLVLAPFDFIPFLNTISNLSLPPKTTANLTLLDAKNNATIWQKEINETMTLAFLYPDITGDSRLEFYTIPNPFSSANFSRIVMYNSNNGNVLWNYPCPQGFNLWAMLASSLGNFTDINGDGKPDFAFAETEGNTGVFENIQVTVISGTTGTEIYQITHRVELTPYPGTEVYVDLTMVGDLSGDGKNDVGMLVTGQTTENDTLSYSYALNGTDGSAMWYTRINSTYREEGIIIGVQMYGALCGVPSSQCDLNGNGKSDDAIVGTSNAVFVVYTLPGPPVLENRSIIWISAMFPISLLTVMIRQRKEEKI